MKHVAAPFGGKQNIETLIKDLQDQAFGNLVNRISQLFKATGVKVGATHGVLGADLKVAITNTDEGLEITAGKALTSTYQFISLNNVSFDQAAVGKTDGFYLVKLRYKEVGSDPVKAVSGYVYAATGSAERNPKTRFNDGYELVLEAVTADLSTITPATDEVLLGAVRVVNDAFSTSDWSSAYPNGSPTVTSGVADLRAQNRMLLASDLLLNDEEVLFKDRAYTGSQSLDKDLEHSGDVKISGTLTINGNNRQYVIQPTGDDAKVESQDGIHQKWFTEGGVPKTFLQYLEAENLKVKVGGEYRDVVTTGPASTTPRNLRIFDIYPTEDPNEKKIYIQVKWNWDALVVTNATASTLTVYNTSYENESLSLSSNDLNTYLPGKSIYFVGSDNEYLIQSVTQDGSTYVFTVDGDPSSETTTEEAPARIIDTNVEYYKLKFKSAAQQGRRAKEIIQLELSGDFITDPTYIQKLEGGRSWYCTIQAVNNSSMGSTVTMSSGSYDPDQSGGGTDVVNYGSPFQAKLPFIPSADNGSVDSVATTQGFNLTIGGWSGNDNQTRPHDFEILYSTTRTITSGMFDSTPLPGDIERVTTRTGYVQIYSPYPARYSVGVRPRQNGMGVATAKILTISSGGGGVVPEDQVLFDDIINIKTTKFEIVRKITSSVFEAVSYSASGDEYENIDARSLIGKKGTIPVIAEQVQNFSTGVAYTASSHTGNTITPSLVNSTGAPYPQFVKFTSSATTDLDSGNDDPNTWAKISSDPISLPSQETISLKLSLAAQNWGYAKINVYLIDETGGVDTTLAVKTFEKTDYHPSSTTNWNVAMTHENNLPTTRSLRWEVRAWGNLGGTSVGHNEIAHVLVDWYAGTLENTQIKGTVGGTTYSQAIEFGISAKPFTLLKEEAITSSSPSEPLAYIRSIVRPYPAASLVKFAQATSLGSGDEFYIGVSEIGRKIVTKKLDVDYKITTLQYDSSFVEGVSSTSPAIIRVYPNDSAGSAVTLEVDGIGFKGAEVNLPVKLSNNERSFTVDAYDVSTLGNNRSEIAGRLFITGKPIVQDRLS